MKIAIDINGVVRDTLGKAEQVYKKFFIDDYVSEEGEESFEYSLNLPISSTTLSNHFAFPTEESFYDFFYVDFMVKMLFSLLVAHKARTLSTNGAPAVIIILSKGANSGRPL